MGDRRFAAAAAPAQQGADPCAQFANAEGLGQVVVGAGVERVDLVVFLGTGRENEYR
jgi:hypothetical protein